MGCGAQPIASRIWGPLAPSLRHSKAARLFRVPWRATRSDRNGCRPRHQGATQTADGTGERADVAAGQFAPRVEQDLCRSPENVPVSHPSSPSRRRPVVAHDYRRRGRRTIGLLDPGRPSLAWRDVLPEGNCPIAAAVATLPVPDPVCIIPDSASVIVPVATVVAVVSAPTAIRASPCPGLGDSLRNAFRKENRDFANSRIPIGAYDHIPWRHREPRLELL
jgi:hypothetical protein